MAKTADAELMDMFSLSETKPRIPEELISRELYLDFVEKHFEENRVLCVDGVEGVGVTTTLALFAKKHSMNCASYFNDGWSRHLLNTQMIEQSLIAQLSFYVSMCRAKKGIPEEVSDTQREDVTLNNILIKINRLTKNNKNKYLFFVFDGLDAVPKEYLDSIKGALAPLFGIGNARFLFSGDKEDIKPLLPDNVEARQTNELMKFQKNDIEEYLLRQNSTLEQDDIKLFYDLSDKGLARNVSILMEKLTKEGIEKLRQYYILSETDFYAEDMKWIEDQDDQTLTMLMALLAFSEIPVFKKLVMLTMGIDEKNVEGLMDRCSYYLTVDERGRITLRSDDYRKYLREKLFRLKNAVELLLINVLEKSSNMGEQFSYLPALYKHVKNNKTLVEYLTSEKVQHYLVEKRSQAALNEQCEYGYNACSDYETQMGAYFRFAINRSVSREIEKNELTDSEIEALIAIGDVENALALTQNVFLMEERLKCLLIIAQESKHLSETMSQEIDRQIDMLTEAIDFEHIPDKALELAKLMLPVKMEKALDIIDKVAKVTRDRHQIDKLYTAISLSYNNEGKTDDANPTKADLLSMKIVDEELRKMATVMKSIMKDNTSEQVVAKMKDLPASSQLYFLRYWIPDHKNREDIGKAVKYAVRLVIDSSATIMPKVSFLYSFCKPLPKMPKDQVKSVIGLLDAVVEIIKFPTVEYVKLMILVISAIVKMDKGDAENRLISLYVEILDLKDKALQAHCKSMLLRDFDKLGNPSDVEKWIGKTAYELKNEIVNDIKEVLGNSAYHIKVVEGPIKALVCFHPDFVEKVISMMNTEERRSRAYLLAASEYVTQTDVKRIDWKYLTKLFAKIIYDRTDIYQPLIDLIEKVKEVNDYDMDLVEAVKKNYSIIKEVEQAGAQCYIMATLYVWLSQYYTGKSFKDGSSVEDFKSTVKGDLDTMWSIISTPWLKVNTGYEIAKVMSKISMKNEAREYVAKATKLRKTLLLSSTSCVAAYNESFDLYAHSLGILIRSGLCRDEDVDQFKLLLDYDEDLAASIILWSRVALEYHGVGDKEWFDKIMNTYVSIPLDSFAKYDRKRIMFNISPALYLSSQALFYDRIRIYDPFFKNACIENIAHYVLTKYPYPEYTSSNDIVSQNILEKGDYDLMLDLMRHTEDDSFIFKYTDIITRSFGNNVGRGLSRELKRTILDSIEEIVEKRLPMTGGIQHAGYKIACKAMINGTRSGSELKPKDLRVDIEAVGNKADQAFLYAQVASYLKKTSDKGEFIELAVKKTEELDYTFDRFNRYELCLQDAFEASPNKAKAIAEKVMGSLKTDGNGSYSDYQRMLDLLRDHDEQLADQMLEMVDNDPARAQYKRRLRLRMQSSKKIEAAKKDLTQVSRLTNNEQIRFFERQMEYLVKKKNVVRNVDTTEPIIAQIYNNPITDTQNAVLFFMENLYQKNTLNKKYRSQIREMHLAMVYNLQLVLAIASGTKEKLDRLSRILAERSDDNANMIPVGRADKAAERIIGWYKTYQQDILYIIDPWFHPDDLYVIKMLMDVNNSLNCSILTHKEGEDSLNTMFQQGWNRVSAEMTGRVEVKSCCYEEKPEKAPFHDRWWILYNADEDKGYGVRMASISTMGSRITEISEMEEAAVVSVLKVWRRFFQNMVAKDEGQKLRYDETVLH